MQHLLTGVAAVAALATLSAGCDSDDALTVPARLSGFHTPESVLHDPERDVYWVSNIGEGGAFGHDGDGFLSRIDPDGTIDARFASRERSGAVLDSPKGMALVDGDLYVTDVDRIRILDGDTGAPLREIAIDGVDMLNDLAAAPDGTLYATDIGVDEAFAPTGREAVYRIGRGGAPERWLAGPELGNPNGVAVTDDAVWLVTFGSGELIEVGTDGVVRARHPAPKGGLDGIEAIGDHFLITSWSDGAVMSATADGRFDIVRDDLETPADLGVDPSRDRLLLPLMNAGEVLIESTR